MKILLCGATGFIGRHVNVALRGAGHQVVRGVSRPHGGPDELVVDFVRDTSAAAWLPRLDGVDAVVVAVGVLRDSAKQPQRAIHADTPAALFEACAQQGVRRVLYVSALGIDGNDSAYAVTKRAAEQRLQALTAQGRLDGTVLRPSVVFGEGGASSGLFLGLARLPVLVLPRPVLQARVQPVHVLELAEAVVRLLAPSSAALRVVECVGPQSVTLADFIASLRAQQGRATARVLPLPDWITRLSAHVGDLIPVGPWGTQALSLLAQDNVGDVTTITALLGRAPTHYRHFLQAKAGAA